MKSTHNRIIGWKNNRNFNQGAVICVNKSLYFIGVYYIIERRRGLTTRQVYLGIIEGWFIHQTCTPGYHGGVVQPPDKYNWVSWRSGSPTRQYTFMEGWFINKTIYLHEGVAHPPDNISSWRGGSSTRQVYLRGGSSTRQYIFMKGWFILQTSIPSYNGGVVHPPDKYTLVS